MGGYNSKCWPIVYTRKYNLYINKIEIVRYHNTNVDDYEELLTYNEDIR